MIVRQYDCLLYTSSGRKEVLATVKRLNQEGVSIVMITHYMEELLSLIHISIITKNRASSKKLTDSSQSAPLKKI